MLRKVGLALLLAGCGGVPAYTSSLPKNLAVVTQIDSGSRFTTTRVALDVYGVSARCEAQLQGRVYLDKSPIEIGIPEARLYLDFVFVSRGTFSGTGTTRYGTLLSPRPGYEYRAQVNYEKERYEVVIREMRKGSAPGRVIDTAPLGGCRPS